MKKNNILVFLFLSAVFATASAQTTVQKSAETILIKKRGDITREIKAEGKYNGRKQSLKSQGYIVEFEKDPILAEKKKLEKEGETNKKYVEEKNVLNPLAIWKRLSATMPENVDNKVKKYSQDLITQNNKTKEEILTKIGQERGKISRGAANSVFSKITGQNQKAVSNLNKEIVKNEFKNVFNGIALDISEKEANEIKKVKGVKSVSPNLEVKATLMDSVPLIGADKVWKSNAGGFTGKGVKIAIIDTGIDYTHPDLEGCFGQGCKVVGGYDFVNNDADPMDDRGHGTHVAGIAAGSGQGGLKGVAPDAKLYAFKVLNSKGAGIFAQVIAGIERAVDPNQDTDFSDKADVINMSLGVDCEGAYGDYCGPDDPLSRAVDNVVDAGIIAVVSAGNNGPISSSIGSPGTARKAITVGATDKKNTIASFSSRGPVKWTDDTGNHYLLKPDIVAPGVDICSSQYDSAWNERKCFNNKHIAISGTSMAAPHVAGVAALLKQKNSAWNPENIKNALKSTAVDLGISRSDQGWGRINIQSAISLTNPIPYDIGTLDISSIPANATVYVQSLTNGKWYEEGWTPASLKLQTGWRKIKISYNGEYYDHIETINIIKDKTSNVKAVLQPNPLYRSEFLRSIYSLGPVDKYNIIFTKGYFSNYIYDAYNKSEKEISILNNPINPYEKFYITDMIGDIIVGNRVLAQNSDWDESLNVFKYDLSDQSVQIIDNEHAPGVNVQPDYPYTDGKTIVWLNVNYDKGKYCGPDDDGALCSTIMAYDLTSQKQFTIKNDDGNYYGHPRVYGNYIVWAEQKISLTSDGETAFYKNMYVHLYDLSTGEEKIIDPKKPPSNDYVLQHSPQIWDNKIVWIETTLNTDSERIKLFDIATSRISYIPLDPNYAPQIGEQNALNVKNNKIVWTQYRTMDYFDGDANIFMYDLNTRQEFKITKTSSYLCNPRISNNIVVWNDDCNNYHNYLELLYMRDISNLNCNNAQCIGVACNQNLDCGINSFAEAPFCKGGDVYQNYKTFTCKNPGTKNSSCSNVIVPQLKTACVASTPCLNGECSAYPVVVYKAKNFGGAQKGYMVGDYKYVGNDWNDKISSVKVAPGYKVIFYAAANYGGASLTRTSDDNNLGPEGWNDKISSLKVVKIQSEVQPSTTPAPDPITTQTPEPSLPAPDTTTPNPLAPDTTPPQDTTLPTPPPDPVPPPPPSPVPSPNMTPPPPAPSPQPGGSNDAGLIYPYVEKGFFASIFSTISWLVSVILDRF